MPVVPGSQAEVWYGRNRHTGPHARPTDRAAVSPHALPASPCSPAAWAARGSCRASCTAPHRPDRLPGGRPRRASVTVVANTADDIWVHGLKVCPDLDTVMYTLGDGIDPERGWGRRDETWNAKEELAAYGVEPTWFGLGDRDIATHLVRTQMLDAGYPLSAVTEALCRRWRARAARLLPMTDDRVETHVAIADPETPAAGGSCTSRSTGSGCAPRCPAEAVVVRRARRGQPRPGRARGDRRRRPGRAAAVQPGRLRRHHPRRARGPRRAARHRRPVVGLSPIVGGTHVRGMAEQLLDLDRRRGQRRRRWPRTTAPASDGGILDGWLVDQTRRGPGRPASTGAGHRVPRRAADDDRPRRHRRDGRRGLDLVR